MPKPDSPPGQDGTQGPPEHSQAGGKPKPSQGLPESPSSPDSPTEPTEGEPNQDLPPTEAQPKA